MPRFMGMFPDLSKYQTMFDEKFGELNDHLVQILRTLELILEELRTPKGAPQ